MLLVCRLFQTLSYYVMVPYRKRLADSDNGCGTTVYGKCSLVKAA